MGYWKQTTRGMIREKEIFNDLSNICEEGRKGSMAWILDNPSQSNFWIIRGLESVSDPWKLCISH